MRKNHHFSQLLLLLFLLPNPLLAQSNFKLDPKTSTFIDKSMMECIYKYTVNAPLKDSVDKRQAETYTTILQANSSVSKFWDFHSFKIDSLNYSHTASQFNTDSVQSLLRRYLAASYFFFPVIVKNYPTGKITVTDEIYPVDYLYEEAKIEHNWTLKDDTLTVCGYLCNKAVTSFGGKEWTAWYAPEITLSDGPWKLYGLPGLILKAHDSSTTHTFEAVTIRKSANPVYVARIPLQVRVQKDVFIKNKIKSENEYQYEVGISEIKSLSAFSSGVAIINGRRSPKNKKLVQTMYCPLELE